MTTKTLSELIKIIQKDLSGEADKLNFEAVMVDFEKFCVKSPLSFGTAGTIFDVNFYDPKESNVFTLIFQVKRETQAYLDFTSLCEKINKYGYISNAYAGMEGPSLTLTMILYHCSAHGSEIKPKINPLIEYHSCKDSLKKFKRFNIPDECYPVILQILKFVNNIEKDQLMPEILFERYQDSSFTIFAENVTSVPIFHLSKLLKLCPNITEIKYSFPEQKDKNLPVLSFKCKGGSLFSGKKRKAESSEEEEDDD